MSGNDTKNNPPLRLYTNFKDALTRFVNTKPSEVAESIAISKQKKPPQEAPQRTVLKSKDKGLI